MKKGIRILAGFAFGAVATAAPERLVTLGASVTEMVFALGAGDAVVARDDSSLYPPEVAERPSVGYFRTIGAEGVLSTRPGLILAAEATGPSDQVALLERSGVPLVLLEDKPSAEALLENVSRVGEVLDRSEAAAALRARLEADLAALREVAAGLDRAPRIVVLMGGSGNGYMAAYEATAAAALIGMIGGVNPFFGYQGYKPTSMEAIVAAEPDFILLTTREPGSDLAPVAAGSLDGGLAVTKAARAGRVYEVDLGRYFVFGPRLPENALKLAEQVAADWNGGQG